MPGQKSICESILDYCYSIWVAPKEEYYPSSDDEDCAISRRGISKRDKVHISEMEIRNRRKQSQKKANQNLNKARVQNAQPAPQNIVDMFPRLPGFFPEFGERTVSASTFRHVEVESKKSKWRSSPDISGVGAESKTSKKNSKSSLNSLTQIPEQKRWTIDETHLVFFENEKRLFDKYQEFIDLITKYNVSPLDREFEQKRWDVKLTHQKIGYKLWRAKLTDSGRVSFLVNAKDRVVEIYTVGKHD